MIRRANQSDVEKVAEIYLRIHSFEQQGRLSTGWLPGVYPVKATAQAALDRDELFVYERDGAVLASAIINKRQVDVYSSGQWNIPAPDDKVMVLHTLNVDPFHRSEGIGREFVEFYENFAFENGCTALRMDTNAKNTAARGFYKKLGYSEIGIVPCVFNEIPDVQLVLLEKTCERQI